ncbi:MAG: DNA cytosine methyltransferase, partial [Candidatus Eisenbacteria bacterium]
GQILEVLDKHRPPFVILENVGNFERHNRGRTWKVVQDSLVELGYNVRGTTHKASGGHGLVSPHHLGYPHTRGRFFIVASQDTLPADPFPRPDRRTTSLKQIVQSNSALSSGDRRETALTRQQIDCIDHWNALLARLPESVELPSFPIWGDEIHATYPYESMTPWLLPVRELRRHVRLNGHHVLRSKQQLLGVLPSYARSEERRFPDWKTAFIRQNRAWFDEISRHLTPTWISRLRDFPSSLRKLEWNCKGEARDLWRYVLQFRPSGLRVKRYTSAPALVAMTTTQIPLLGPKRRFLTRVEGLRLQGFPDGHLLPTSRARCFAALGNAVHVGVVRTIAERALGGSSASQ